MTPERYERVQELFLRACELRKSDRQAFLDQQCAEDVELREQVESLLDHDDPNTLIREDTERLSDASTHGKPDAAVQSRTGSFGHTVQTLGLITKRLGPRGHLALGVFIACVVLTAVGVFLQRSLGTFQRTLRAEALQEIVDAKISGMEMWFDHEEEKVESWTRSQEFQRLAAELVQLSTHVDDVWDTIQQSPLQDAIQQELHRLAGERIEFTIWDRRSIAIADSWSAGKVIGAGATPFGAAILTRVFDGETGVVAYDKGHTITRRDLSDDVKPHIGVVAPIRDLNGHVIASLLVHDNDAREQASRILRMVELGVSGETYVFNGQGVMLSQSRFTDQLRDIGLLPVEDGGDSIRTLRLHDPGGNMVAGYRPTEPLSTRPLTKMARQATAGVDGYDVDGYRDYRGVMVVGAWRWLDKYDIGVATELDLGESEPGHWVVTMAAWVVFALFATSLAFIVVSYYSIHRMRHQIGEHRQLGQYTLQQQIGEGGMGKVFRAKHEFLKRPTAIKLLKPELVDRQSIARFEQEARLASQLMHPNTVDVYDYGVTPDGLFFFVMDFIDGPSLRELVERHGPLPPTRAVHVLRQICESLDEAHGEGMIHRDLKPQNIMICRRGGQADVIKVLDFGLVKSTQSTESQQLTASTLLAGTPLYIAPERIRDPHSANARTDIYSLGAVTFFLLTGREVFQCKTVADVLFQAMHTDPPRASELQADIPPELDQLVVDCLAKDPDRRPESVSQIIRVLDGLRDLEAWHQDMAQRWWNDHMPAQT